MRHLYEAGQSTITPTRCSRQKAGPDYAASGLFMGLGGRGLVEAMGLKGLPGLQAAQIAALSIYGFEVPLPPGLNLKPKPNPFFQPVTVQNPRAPDAFRS